MATTLQHPALLTVSTLTTPPVLVSFWSWLRRATSTSTCGTVRIFSHPPPSPATLYRWVRQAAEGLAFAHSCGVLHSDIHCVNFLLDGALNLKAADFTGASIGGGKSWSTYRLTHRLLFAEPKGDSSSLRMDIMTVSEIFGLGSVLYSIVTGHDLFPEMDYTRDRAEIAWRLRQRRFSDIRELSVVRSVVTRCWNVEYDSMVDVIEGIDAESGLFAGRSMVWLLVEVCFCHCAEVDALSKDCRLVKSCCSISMPNSTTGAHVNT
jgi:serine/threonine protein kinase